VVWLAIVFASTMVLVSILHQVRSAIHALQGYISYTSVFESNGIPGSERFLLIRTRWPNGLLLLDRGRCVGLIIRLRRRPARNASSSNGLPTLGAHSSRVIAFIALDSSGQHGLADIAFTTLILLILVGIRRSRGRDLKYALRHRPRDQQTLLFGAMAASSRRCTSRSSSASAHCSVAAAAAQLALSIVATAIVAVAFNRSRRVQRLANRLVYGKRARL